MNKTSPRSTERGDATLRVSKRMRDRLKTASAALDRSLYDVTNELIEDYLRGLKLPSVNALRRGKRG